MKKLLITAIGAAVAFGAFADAVRFEESGVGPITALSQLPGGTNFWSEPAGATNTYAIGAAGSVTAPLSIASGESSPTNALDIKTTFGKPLSLNAVSGGTPMDINDGLYFDSLVKFTVCDADQNTAYAAYDDAKIVMWLEQNEAETQTNLIVQAGYLSWDNTEGKYVSTPTNYVCALPGSFNIDAWHRVTIKAIADITTGYGIPGFAIYLDQSGDTVRQFINAGTAAMWDGETLESELTEAAAYLNGRKALFPSRKLGSGQDLTSVGFDGTGSITDLIFTENGPAFAQDYVAPKASVKIGNDDATEYGSLAEAVAAVSGLTDGQTATLKLIKGVTLEEPLTVNAEYGTVIIDFAGNVWTNALTDAAITNNAAALVITNSVGNGGIYCTDRDNGVAIYNNGGLAIYGGTINGLFEIGENSSIEIFGGSFFDSGVEEYLADGKVLKENTETDLFDVIDAPNYVAQITGGAKYATLKEAVDAASAGDTVTVLADCTESGMVTFNSGITISNNYTVALTGMYALRFANGSTPVTICGTGTLAGSGTGSPLLIGSNETTKDAKYLITTTYEGSVILDGNTITYSGSGNVIKVEYGTFTMNSGTVTAGGNRGVKADADVGNFTSTVIINGGTITSTKAAVASSASADTGKTTSGTANVTINGGEITGPLTCGQNTSGTATLVIPGTSTAKFDRDQSAFCASGYETTQSGDWYVVTAVKPSGIDPANNTPVVIEAESVAAATNAVTLVTPDGVDATAYKALFDFTATEKSTGVYEVSIAGIKEEVEVSVEESAMDVLDGKSGAKVQVPAGLYYKVTTYTELGGKAVATESDLSDGTGVSVSKPGTTQGFIKVEMGTKAFNQQ